MMGRKLHILVYFLCFSLLLCILYQSDGLSTPSPTGRKSILNRYRSKSITDSDKIPPPSKAAIQRDISFPVTSLTIDATTLSKKEFREKYDGKWPIVMRNVFKNFNEEEWTERLISLLAGKKIEFDIRVSESNEVETYESTLADFLEGVAESTHEESFYLMNEGVLNEAEELMKQVTLPTELFGENYFDTCFPDSIRPKTALIIGNTLSAIACFE